MHLCFFLGFREDFPHLISRLRVLAPLPFLSMLAQALLSQAAAGGPRSLCFGSMQSLKSNVLKLCICVASCIFCVFGCVFCFGSRAVVSSCCLWFVFASLWLNAVAQAKCIQHVFCFCIVQLVCVRWRLYVLAQELFPQAAAGESHSLRFGSIRSLKLNVFKMCVIVAVFSFCVFICAICFCSRAVVSSGG